MKRFQDPPVSDHFKEGRFFVPWLDQNIVRVSIKNLLKWRMGKSNIPWPKEVSPDFVIKQTPQEDQKNFIQFVNHSTVLMDVGGIRLITDPLFSDRAGPKNMLGPRRAHALPFLPQDLGRLDFVLLSHNHYDHFDAKALQKLSSLFPHLHFIVPHSNGPYLKEIGIRKDQITELDWWESVKVKGINVSLAPAQHWSRRNFRDRNFALWGSFVVECSKTQRKIYFAGDSGYGPHFKEIQKKWDSFDFSLIPVGAYEPRWFMKYSHMNPEEAVRAHLDLNSKKSIGIHHSCFKLTDEAWDDPKKDLFKALEKYGLEKSHFLYPKPGEIF